MFDKQYRFTGTHARMVEELTAVFDSESKAKLFDRNYDVYNNAALVGFLFQRKGIKNNEEDYRPQNIFPEQMINNSELLTYILRLILILDKDYEPDLNKRLDKAFRNLGQDESDLNLFDEYTLGGVEVFYEKLIKDVNSPSEYINRLYDFLEEFNDRFNSEISNEDILSLTKKM